MAGNDQGFADAFPSDGWRAIVGASQRSEAAPMHVISTSDLMASDWNFLADLNPDPALTFQSFSSLQPSGFASLVPHPVAARRQAAARACRAARRRPDAILFTHLPMMAAVTNLARRVMAPAVPQIAFAFNFTTLRDDTRARFFARAFRGITEFVVYSSFERELYAEAFGIPVIVIVIVTDSIGIRDYTDGGRVAALVPPGSAEAFAVALDRLLGDDVQRQQARAGIALARREHDPRLWLDYVREKAALLGPVG